MDNEAKNYNRGKVEAFLLMNAILTYLQAHYALREPRVVESDPPRCPPQLLRYLL